MAMLLCAVVAAWYSLKKVSWYYPLMCFFCQMALTLCWCSVLFGLLTGFHGFKRTAWYQLLNCLTMPLY